MVYLLDPMGGGPEFGSHLFGFETQRPLNVPQLMVAEWGTLNNNHRVIHLLSLAEVTPQNRLAKVCRTEKYRVDNRNLSFPYRPWATL